MWLVTSQEFVRGCVVHMNGWGGFPILPTLIASCLAWMDTHCQMISPTGGATTSFHTIATLLPLLPNLAGNDLQDWIGLIFLANDFAALAWLGCYWRWSSPLFWQYQWGWLRRAVGRGVVHQVAVLAPAFCAYGHINSEGLCIETRVSLVPICYLSLAQLPAPENFVSTPWLPASGTSCCIWQWMPCRPSCPTHRGLFGS